MTGGYRNGSRQAAKTMRFFRSLPSANCAHILPLPHNRETFFCLQGWRRWQYRAKGIGFGIRPCYESQILLLKIIWPRYSLFFSFLLCKMCIIIVLTTGDWRLHEDWRYHNWLQMTHNWPTMFMEILVIYIKLCTWKLVQLWSISQKIHICLKMSLKMSDGQLDRMVGSPPRNPTGHYALIIWKVGSAEFKNEFCFLMAIFHFDQLVHY